MFVTVINAYSGDNMPTSYTKAGHKIAKLHFLRWLCWAFPRAQLRNWRQRAQPWALSVDSANRAPHDPPTVLFYATGDLQEWKHLSSLRAIKWRGNVKELVTVNKSTELWRAKMRWWWVFKNGNLRTTKQQKYRALCKWGCWGCFCNYCLYC